MREINNKEKDFYNINGFLLINNFVDKNTVKKLKKITSNLVKGKYKTQITPDKVKKGKNKPIQLCNVWKSDYNFARLVLSKKIAEVALQLTKWHGVRLNQDSLFYVPPRTGGVTMHQDVVYQDWHNPGKIITAWIALTDMNKNNSSIKYIPGSHKWKKNHKPLKTFFKGKNFMESLTKFKKSKKNKIITIEATAGSVVFHHGKTWHGSGINHSNDKRISLSCHLMPSNSKFSQNKVNPVFSRYKKFNSLEMDENFFPVILTKKKTRSKLISKII